MNLVTEKYEEVAREAARQKDSRILDAIEIHTGERWHDMLTVKESMSVAHYPDGREVYSWGETPIVAFMPTEFVTEQNGASTKVITRTKYKILV